MSSRSRAAFPTTGCGEPHAVAGRQAVTPAGAGVTVRSGGGGGGTPSRSSAVDGAVGVDRGGAVGRVESGESGLSTDSVCWVDRASGLSTETGEATEAGLSGDGGETCRVVVLGAVDRVVADELAGESIEAGLGADGSETGDSAETSVSAEIADSALSCDSTLGTDRRASAASSSAASSMGAGGSLGPASAVVSPKAPAASAPVAAVAVTVFQRERWRMVRSSVQGRGAGQLHR
jgi:hypothetical protein